MINGLLDSTSVPLLEQVARFTTHRQRYLAANVANIDTPGYTPQDLPVEQFRDAVREAVEVRRGDRRLGTPQNPDPPVEKFFSEKLFQPRAAPPQNVTFHDGSRRSIEKAVMTMMKTAGEQRFAVEVMASQLNMLQTVISERP